MSLQYKHLICVEGVGTSKSGLQENKNKFYEMRELGDGTFEAIYGRVGAAKPAREVYPMSKWDFKLREKLVKRKPPYEDITHLVAIQQQTKSNQTQIIHKLPEVVALIEKLQEAANLVVSATYLVKSNQVTQIQVDSAQKCIDKLSVSFSRYFGKSKWDLSKFNHELKKLFKTIPRKMKSVSDNLINEESTKEEIASKIEEEQGFLDAMAGQVVTNTATNTTPDDSTIDPNTQQSTLLDKMGLEMEVADDKTFKEMVKMLDNNGHRLQKVFKVKNVKTQELFDKNISSVDKAKQKTKLLFHGSRSQNWIFILEQGLKIRPSGAIHTGSLIGDAVYFANDGDKSLGYTDNGRWVNGKAHGSVYMGVYKVRTGKPLEMRSEIKAIHNPKNELFNKGYCSVHAFKGANYGYNTLRKDEITIYDSDQSTIEYLLQIKA